jgi:hypothetical protein
VWKKRQSFFLLFGIVFLLFGIVRIFIFKLEQCFFEVRLRSRGSGRLVGFVGFVAVLCAVFALTLSA